MTFLFVIKTYVNQILIQNRCFGFAWVRFLMWCFWIVVSLNRLILVGTKLSLLASAAFNSGNVHFTLLAPPSCSSNFVFAQFQFYTSARYTHSDIRNASNFQKRKLSNRFFAHQYLKRKTKPKTSNWKCFRCHYYMVVVDQLGVLYRFLVAAQHNNSIIFSCAAALSERRVFFPISLWWTIFCLHDSIFDT